MAHADDRTGRLGQALLRGASFGCQIRQEGERGRLYVTMRGGDAEASWASDLEHDQDVADAMLRLFAAGLRTMADASDAPAVADGALFRRLPSGAQFGGEE